MARFSGIIGFVDSVEKVKGVWEDRACERRYKGDILSFYRGVKNGDNLNDDLTVSNRISIVADPFARENIYRIRYVYIWGSKWKVTNVEAAYPRLILSVGGLYNE